jgi:battenin
MLLVALTPSTESHASSSIAVKLIGVVLASLSSGGGESSFLSLTHYYGHVSLASWSSGTGAAGLVGAGAYLIATTWIGWSVSGTLFACASLPLIMLAAFFVVLPLDPLRKGKMAHSYQQLVSDQLDDEDENGPFVEDSQAQTLLTSPSSSAILSRPKRATVSVSWYHQLRHNLRRTRRLIIP